MGNRNRHRRSCPISPRNTKDGMRKAWNDVVLEINLVPQCLEPTLAETYSIQPAKTSHFLPHVRQLKLRVGTSAHLPFLAQTRLQNCHFTWCSEVIFGIPHGSPVAAPDPPQRPSNMDTNQEATNRSQIRRWTKSTSWPDIKRYELKHQDHQG